MLGLGWESHWAYTVQCTQQEFRYLHLNVSHPPQNPTRDLICRSYQSYLPFLLLAVSLSAALSFPQIYFILLKIRPHYRELIWNTIKSSVTCIHWCFRLISLVCCNHYRKQDVIMVNVRINEEEKKANIKGHCIVQQALSRNVTGPHKKFPCEFVNTDFHLSSCSFSLHVHSGFSFPVVSQCRGNPASHCPSMVPPQTIPARQTGNPLCAGIVKFSWWFWAFYTLSLPVLFYC